MKFLMELGKSSEGQKAVQFERLDEEKGQKGDVLLTLRPNPRPELLLLG